MDKGKAIAWHGGLGGRVNIYKKKSCSTDTFWSLLGVYDYDPKIECHTWYGQENDIICNPKSSNPNLNGEVCGSDCRKWNCGRKYTCSMHSSLCVRYWGTLWRLFSIASSSRSQFWCQKLRCLYGELSTSHHSLPSWMESPLPSMCCEYIHIPKFF